MTTSFPHQKVALLSWFLRFRQEVEGLGLAGLIRARGIADDTQQRRLYSPVNVASVL